MSKGSAALDRLPLPGSSYSFTFFIRAPQGSANRNFDG